MFTFAGEVCVEVCKCVVLGWYMGVIRASAGMLPCMA